MYIITVLIAITQAFFAVNADFACGIADAGSDSSDSLTMSLGSAKETHVHVSQHQSYLCTRFCC
jgi:hypothetical protein